MVQIAMPMSMMVVVTDNGTLVRTPVQIDDPSCDFLFPVQICAVLRQCPF